MKFYPFNDTQQHAIRHLGFNGFAYAGETQKAITFYRQTDNTWVYWNRDIPESLVLAEADASLLVGWLGVVSVSARASSNFRKFPKRITSRGKENHSGIQVVMSHPSCISQVLARLAGKI